MELLSNDGAHPLGSDPSLVVSSVALGELTGDVVDRQSRLSLRNHILDDLKNLRLHIHASILNEFAADLARELSKIFPRPLVFNDAQEGNEYLIQARLNGAVH